jgi:hypothetical protein
MMPKSNPNPKFSGFRYSVRTLLVVATATCVVLGVLQWLLPPDIPIGMRVVVSVMIGALIAYAAWIFYQSKRHPWKTPEDYVIVKVDAKWKRRVRSPIIMGPIAAFTGVSLTFAPLYLFSCGQADKFGVFEWIAVPLCFLVIYLVPGFYMSLAFRSDGRAFQIGSFIRECRRRGRHTVGRMENGVRESISLSMTPVHFSSSLFLLRPLFLLAWASHKF